MVPDIRMRLASLKDAEDYWKKKLRLMDDVVTEELVCRWADGTTEVVRFSATEARNVVARRLATLTQLVARVEEIVENPPQA